jgi:hypothetical protein
MLVAQHRMHHNMIELQIGEFKILLPQIFFDGLLMFISVPGVAMFSQHMLDIINQIVSSPSAPMMLPPFVNRFLLTNNAVLVKAVLSLITLDNLLIYSTSFGISDQTKELIYQQIALFDDLKLTIAISGLNEAQRNVLDSSRFARFLGSIEEEHFEKRETKQDQMNEEEETIFDGNVRKLIESAYANDHTAISMLRSLLLSKKHTQEITQQFLSLSSLHHTNTHLTLMIISCLDNIQVKGGDDQFQYMMSLRKSNSTSDIEEYPMQRQLQVPHSHHLVQEKLSKDLPPLDSYFNSEHRGLIADLITRHDPIVSTPSLRRSNDPYLSTLMVHQRDAQQLKQSIDEMLSLGLQGLGLVGTVLETVEGVQVDERFVQSVGKILEDQHLSDLMKSKPEYLTILLDSIIPKSLLDPDLENKNRNRKALTEALGPNSQIIQYLYCLSPDHFPTPDMIKYASKMEVFLHSLVLKMTDTEVYISDFAFALLRKCAKCYPKIVCRYIKTLGAILETSNNDLKTAAEVVSRGLIRRYSQVLEIVDALRPEIFNHLDVINRGLIDKFFLFIRSVLLQVPIHQSFETPEQAQLREFITAFLTFLRTYTSDEAMLYLSKYDDLIRTVTKKFNAEIAEKPTLENICFVQNQISNGTLQILDHSRPDILPHVLHQLTDLLLTEDAPDAYRLLLRALQFDSNLADVVIPKYLACLQHHDDTIRLNAVAQAYDFFLHCTNRQKNELLQLLFQSGKKDGLNMLTRIMNVYIRI